MRAEQQTVNQEKRIALVIGNGAYKSITPLKNPPNDAQAVASALKSLGFEVISRINANKKAMREAINQFGSQIRGSGVGLFYYAGHGIQSSGRNYLVPVNADIESEGDVEDEAVSVDQILSRMGDAGNRMNIVILDACRNNPFSTFRSVSRGLTQMVAPSGTFIAYATAPGSVAEDGDGENGVYTQALLKEIQTPGVQLEDVFKNVLTDVKKQTGDKQVPWTSSSVEGKFYFAQPSSEDQLPQVDLPDKPQTKSMNLSDLDAAAKKEEDVKSAWANTLKQMKTDYQEVLSYEKRDVSPDLKRVAWERFLATYEQDDPYATDDERMKHQAQDQIAHWSSVSNPAKETTIEATSANANPLEDPFNDFQGSGTITIKSSEGIEQSIEDAKLKHGIFTFRLLQALRGIADYNNDGIVMADEIARYIKETVPNDARDRGMTQNPTVVSNYAGFIPICRNPRTNNAHNQTNFDKAESIIQNKAFALIVGVGAYADGGVKGASYADMDAKELADILADPHYGGFRKENVNLLVDQTATTAAIKTAIGVKLKTAPKDAIVIVFFVGRSGVEGNDSYWLTYDTDPTSLYASALSNRELVEMLGRLNASRVVMLIDAQQTLKH